MKYPVMEEKVYFDGSGGEFPNYPTIFPEEEIYIPKKPPAPIPTTAAYMQVYRYPRTSGLVRLGRGSHK